MANKYNKKGIALYITLALLAILSILSIVVLLTAYNYSNITENQIKRLTAITSAEAGLTYAFWQMRTDSTYGTTWTDEDTDYDTISINDYDVKIWIDSSSGKDLINAKVEY